MDKPVSDNLISIIVPVHNSQDYLDTCLRSICNQTYNNIEIIIIDDGSSDNSGILCDTYASDDSRIRVIHKKNTGLVAARKTGIENARGEYITFVDSDDYIDLDSYETLMRKLDMRKPDIILYNLVEEYPDHSCEKHNHFREGLYTKEDIRKIIRVKIHYIGVMMEILKIIKMNRKKIVMMRN